MLVVHRICDPGDHPLRNPFPDENDAAFLVTVGIPTDVEAKVHFFKVTVTRQPESQDSGIKKLECDQTDQRFARPKIKRGPSRNPGLQKIGVDPIVDHDQVTPLSRQERTRLMTKGW